MRPNLPTRSTLTLLVAAALLLVAQSFAQAPAEVPPAFREALDRISADSLKGHLSFLASDLLEGRGTPSKGLDIAAEYIAAQFRRAGLEPIGDDGYFQTADWKYRAPDPGSASVEIKLPGGKTIPIGEGQITASLSAGLDIPPTPAVKVATDIDALKALTSEQVAGKVVVAEVPNPSRAERSKAGGVAMARAAFYSKMQELKPAAVVDVDREERSVHGLRSDASGRGRPQSGTPRITLHSPALAAAFTEWPAGATVAIHIGEPTERTAKVRNVVGLLRGSDPRLKNTYVLVSAHYDHLGVGAANAAGDRIYNGANDDGSGTVSVIEIASALATLKQRPARSVVFMTFYGEEHGLVGSRYYTSHPVVPLAETVAAINLEQLGRTDDDEGPRVSAANVTGYDYSDVAAILKKSGAAVGVDVVKHPANSDRYFGASDNAALAQAGVPAHTISVAYSFPDYHGLDDEWERVDYANMAKVDRMAALAVLTIASDPKAPEWSKDNPKAERYRKARTSK
jgi:hypothetical protein